MLIMRSTGADRRRESREKQDVRKLGRALFAIYMALLIYFLFFADWYDHSPGAHWTYHYNIYPFVEIKRFLTAGNKLSVRSVMLNLFGNVIGFMPFGFFLPVMDQKFEKWWIVTGLAAAVSFCVEIIQLVTKTGCYDIDDVILNTLGGLIGYFIFYAADSLRLFRKYGRRK